MLGISPAFEVGFEDMGTGRRFLAAWAPRNRAPHAVLILLPPFGEEVNKSRRTIAASARLFALRGFASLAVDLLGCGDSPGDFSEASWSAWEADVRATVDWAASRWKAPAIAWCIRGGALLAPALSDRVASFLFWQPVTSGETQLVQLLRMRVANERLSGRSASTTKELRATLEAGETLEVSGYELAPELVLPMSRVELGKWSVPRAPFGIYEVGSGEDRTLSAATARFASHATAGDCDVTQAAIPGAPFWNSLEIVENLSLAEASLPALEATVS
ncbi:MAG: hydrolase 2, exosortase A system-associated [Betaproteobacteria bacterium]|nr:hydrolase 2, exosortase A system-associated [Betaproteobacteria bacterium]